MNVFYRSAVPFEGSHLWQLRQLVGHQLVLTPASIVVAFDSHGAVLLMQRADTGDWCIPGGTAEPGQTFTTAAAAELFEETGLVADPDSLVAFGCVSDPRWTDFVFPNGDRVQSFNLCFVATCWEGTPVAEEGEALDVGFFPRDALPAPMLQISLRVLELHVAWDASGVFQVS